MKTNIKKLLIAPLTLLLVIAIGCAEEKKDEDAAGAEDGSGGFSSSDISKQWTGACEAGTHPVLTTANHFKRTLNLDSSGTFSYDEYWYNGTCQTGNTTLVHLISGSWALSGTGIVFHVGGSSYSSLMPYINQTQTDFNNDCGGTSPWAGGVNSGNNGGHGATYNMLCQHISLPNSTQDNIFNIVNYENGVLSLGAPAVGIPGQFNTGSVAATATVQFN
jgi:hypothetical protein